MEQTQAEVEQVLGEQEMWQQSPENQLVRVGSSFILSSDSLLPAPGHPPTFGELEQAAHVLRDIDSHIKFWLGDIRNLGESLFAEEASQVFDASFMDERSLNHCGYVAKQVAPKTRAMAPIQNRFAYCKVVAGLKPEQQEEWLKKAVENDWSTSKLQTEVNAAAVDGKTFMAFTLVVDCGTEAKQAKLAADLEKEGFRCTARSSLKKKESAKKKPGPKKQKAGEVTAKKRRGAPKMYTQRRPPA